MSETIEAHCVKYQKVRCRSMPNIIAGSGIGYDSEGTGYIYFRFKKDEYNEHAFLLQTCHQYEHPGSDFLEKGVRFLESVNYNLQSLFGVEDPEHFWIVARFGKDLCQHELCQLIHEEIDRGRAFEFIEEE